MGSALARSIVDGCHSRAVFGCVVICCMLPSVLAADDEACRADERTGVSGCSGEAREAKFARLRWRVASYKDGKRSVYGGPVVEQALAGAGFGGPVADDDWDLFYTHFPQGKAVEAAKLPKRAGRLVNHCQYFTAAGQKCHLAGHLARVELARALRGEGDAPGSKPRNLETYNLHKVEESAAWRQAMRNQPERHWLVKTCSGGASRGITLVSSADEDVIAASIGTWSVAQEYLHHPLLSAGGRKFHMRLYLHVSRWEPVGVMLYDDGLVFRSRHVHDGARPSQQRDIFSSVSADVEPLSVQTVWAEIGSERAALAQQRLRKLLADVFGSAVRESFGEPGRLAARGFDCYDMFGLDVMFDTDLRPYLLEVNSGPNLWVDRQGDVEEKMLRAVKEPLVRQLAAWAAARVRQRTASPTLAQCLEIEDLTLVNFTRVL
mmetsp:Transcript_79170/g.227023  ORF Transcript_79170/g.227023 Transcript_79170/m.227023 type:complete len:434 (+) Transcript_79170:56-1357(+)